MSLSDPARAGLETNQTSLERPENGYAATLLERIFREEWEKLPNTGWLSL
jgi:hypothetical protein